MLNNPLLSEPADTTGVSFFSTFVPAAIGLAFIIGILIFLGNLIIGVIQWINSGSEKQVLAAARSKITNAFVGIVALFSVYAIIGFVGYFLCVDLTVLTFDNLVVSTTSSGGTTTSCPAMPGGGGTGTGTGNGNGNGTTTGQGLSACGCVTGGCAAEGAIALGNQTGGTTCNQCTTSGWVVVSGTCSGNNPITCYSTCN